ncbi:MAG: type I 3-dehydroquinate dehydratase [Chlorobiaceae bacterium]|nr:type I 3-dehydroquinate dehydratase [Chlorobiaceae bacterium]
MKICLSIAPNSMRDALKMLRDFRDTPDLIEVRIDGIQDLNLAQLLHHPRPKVIITNRRKAEVGIFPGSANQQYEILSEAIRLGAEYVDVEFSWGDKFTKNLLSQSNKTKVICSYHNFKETPKKLESLYRKMRKTGAHIIKIATTANDIADNKLIFDLLKQSRRDKQKMIALCMGVAGEISRILGGKFGSYLTYASLTEKAKTADGQLTYNELINLYDVDQINYRTKVFGLVGNPVKQSKGIYFHNKIFIGKRLDAVYVNFLVCDLHVFISKFRNVFNGLSVTMPFKEEIANLLDRFELDSVRLGIYNTVIKRNDKLIGYNTDLPAMISLLKKRTNLRGKNVVVLGTGAIAKTMAYAALSNNCITTIIGRNPNKAEILAKELGCEWTTFDDLHSLDPDILMNGTSVGMKGNRQQSIVPKSFFKKGMIVFDAVYNPVMTPLLQDAVKAGCEVITGLELFEKQAQLQSKLFIESMKW